MCVWGKNKIVKLAYPMENSKRTKILVDFCLYPIIFILNKYKIHTVGCCCGHFKANGGILIHPDSFKILDSGYCELIIKDKNVKSRT